MDELNKRFDSLEKLIKEQSIHQKEVLNFNEACQYLELSQSHLYKLTSAANIPFYKPNGKKLYFKREELENWLLRNRSTSSDEIVQSADDLIIKKGRAIS
jgi:excisionase family DNA binding protein